MVTATAAGPPRSGISHYYLSFAATFLALVAGFLIAGVTGAFTVAVLAVLETSLSLDNAVVNAKVLENWPDKWRKIFLRWGILVAVFGMRLVFPILIVCVVSRLSPVNVVDMALYRPDDYAKALIAAHPQIAGFGSAFLFMVALSFFFEEKHVYWIEWIETKLTKFGQIEGIAAAIVIGLLFLFRAYAPPEVGNAYLFSGVTGIACFALAHGLGTVLGAPDGEEEETADEGPAVTATAAPGNQVAEQIVRASIAGFLYLEILDASFSFDGVIGAFVITTYLPLIMLGLGAGAFFVRSFTVHMVDIGTMAEYRYLGHGAFYAILLLAAILSLTVTGMDIPEWFTGLSGAFILGIAFWRSVVANQQDELLLTKSMIVDSGPTGKGTTRAA